jgi:2-oxoglutarate ferredoxin oxidoreductase subunit alpha
MILSDGILGQMMEPVVFEESQAILSVEKEWATTGAVNRKPNVVNTLDIIPESFEQKLLKLMAKYERIKDEEVRWEEVGTEDAELILVGYGTSARVARSAMDLARKEGLKVGLFRPITLFPFPERQLRALAKPERKFLAVEMSAGQMIEDVRLAVNGQSPVHLSNRLGGMVPTPEDVLAKMREILEGRGN